MIFCDGVEISAQETIKIIYNFYENNIKNSKISEDMLMMAKYLEKMTPVFTAAGFLKINRNTIVDLANSSTSYMIIILQFKNIKN